MYHGEEGIVERGDIIFQMLVDEFQPQEATPKTQRKPVKAYNDDKKVGKAKRTERTQFPKRAGENKL